MEIFQLMFYKIKGVRFVLKFLLSYESKLLWYKQKLSR